ncbi:hypothetical protein [Pseudomonas syringae]
MQTSEQIEAAVDLLKASLEIRPEKHITGAVFGELVRKTTPELDIRAIGLPEKATFSRFIDKYFTGILHRSKRQGSDWLYTIGGSASPIPQEPDYGIWRAFVRPNSKLSVGLVEPSQALIVMDNDNPTPSARLISSVTLAELTTIIAAFNDSETSSGNTNLPDASQSYPLWTAELREKDRATYRRWTEFRITRLIGVFRDRLATLDLAPDRLDFLVGFLERSRNARPVKAASKPVKSVLAIEGSSLPVHGVATTELELKNLVLRAVMNLSMAELRELRLPVGAMLDALAGPSKN